MKVGLALGSGAAKGWAHIGVLRALERKGIQPDIIAGCSIGSIVGAAYVNHRLDDLQDWVSNFSNLNVMSLFDFNFRRGGLMTGNKAFYEMVNVIGHPDLNIENLHKPFAAVATDLYRGQEVWFREGNLLNAIRASSSIPGIFAPVKHENRWLIDGGVINPLPVSLCRAMGADTVIAVDLHSYFYHKNYYAPVELTSQQKTSSQLKKDTKQSQGFADLFINGRKHIASIRGFFQKNDVLDMGMLAVMNQSINILEYRYKRSRLMGDPPELRIMPKVSHIATMEFNRAQEAIHAGEEAVDKIEHLLEAELTVV